MEALLYNLRFVSRLLDIDETVYPHFEPHGKTGNGRCCSSSVFWKGAGKRPAKLPVILLKLTPQNIFQ